MSFIKNTISFILIIFTSCSALENRQEANFEVHYKAETRGNSMSISLKDNSIVFKSNLDDKSIVLNNVQLKSIKDVLSEIKLTEIKDLEAPSNKRFSDGALSASFTIKKDTVSYMSSDFDHGNPPKELKILYILLEKYSK